MRGEGADLWHQAAYLEEALAVAERRLAAGDWDDVEFVPLWEGVEPPPSSGSLPWKAEVGMDNAVQGWVSLALGLSNAHARWPLQMYHYYRADRIKRRAVAKRRRPRPTTWTLLP
jgi:hypothetical protein